MKKHLITFLLLTFITLLGPAAPVWAAGDVTATLTPNRETLTVGDPVQLTLKVTHPTGTQVIVPKLEQSWGDFEVRVQTAPETVTNADGTTTTRETIEVTLFATGDFQTPELPLTLSDETGQLTELVAEPVSLTVTPVLTEGDTTLRDIKPQMALPLPAWWPWLVSGAVLALAVAGGGWWWLRRRGAGLVIDNRLPYQVALDELGRIEGLRLPDQGRFKEYYSLVTDCLRGYLEKQHDVRAFDRTTVELKASLRESTLSTEQRRRFISIFAESDWVKFARFIPEMEMARQLLTQARILVNAAKPSESIQDKTQDGDTPVDKIDAGRPSSNVRPLQMNEQRR